MSSTKSNPPSNNSNPPSNNTNPPSDNTNPPSDNTNQPTITATVLEIPSLSYNNPYTSYSHSYYGENRRTPSPNLTGVRTNNGLIYIPVDMSERAVYLEKMGSIVKFLCAIDIFFGFLNFFVGPLILPLIGVICGFCGYQGVKYFKRSLVMIYIGYLCFISLLRLIYPFVFQNYMEKNFPGEKYNYESLFAFYFILAIIEIILCRYVIKFYKLLPKTLQARRELLGDIRV